MTTTFRTEGKAMDYARNANRKARRDGAGTILAVVAMGSGWAVVTLDDAVEIGLPYSYEVA